MVRLYNFHRSNDLSLKGYNLHHVASPGIVKKGGVCDYHNETLAVHFLQTKLDQYIVSEVTFKKKKGHMISLYRSPSQTPHQFDNFVQYLRNFCKIFLNLRVPLTGLPVTSTAEIPVGILEIL